MSWFGKRMLKIASVATLLGVGGGAIKSPNEQKIADNDKNEKPVELVVIKTPNSEVVEAENVSVKEGTTLNLEAPWMGVMFGIIQM